MVSLLPFASFGDIFGYRRVYRFGLVLYTAAALISATAGSLEMLILGPRAAGPRRRRANERQHRAGPLHLSAPAARAAASRMVSLVVSVVGGLGPSIAGGDPRGRPMAVAVRGQRADRHRDVVLSMRLLPHTKPSEHRFDMWSAVLCALMFVCLISGITGSATASRRCRWLANSRRALATGYLLVRRQSIRPMPLLPVDLFRRPIFALSVTTSVCSFIAQGIAFVSLPFYFHDVLGVSAVATGLMMTPWAAMTAIMAPIAGHLADRYPAGILGGIGLAILAVGFVLLALLPAIRRSPTYCGGWRCAASGLAVPVAEQSRDRDERAARTQRRRRRDPGHGAAARAVDRRGAGGARFRRFRRHARRDRSYPGGCRFRRRRRIGEPQPAFECRAPPADVAPDALVAEGTAAREPAE